VENAFQFTAATGPPGPYETERLDRDAPLLVIGEGTSDAQRMVIAKKLLERNKKALR
jgi:alkylation response protein AidB-like acyl-CoA dehydrogenase